MSMITTIIRITNHHVLFKRSAYTTAVAFGTMWVAILVQKLYDCDTRTCHLEPHAVTSQLVSESHRTQFLAYTLYPRYSSADVISDTLLLILPLCFLRGVKIERDQRVLLVSSFASSICITIISITHSVFLLRPYSATSLILGHVKVRAP